jgi:hypothetical protein
VVEGSLRRPASREPGSEVLSIRELAPLLQLAAGWLLAIDPIIDMRTATNVAGQALVPTIGAKREGVLDLDRYRAPRGADPLRDGPPATWPPGVVGYARPGCRTRACARSVGGAPEGSSGRASRASRVSLPGVAYTIPTPRLANLYLGSKGLSAADGAGESQE